MPRGRPKANRDELGNVVPKEYKSALELINTAKADCILLSDKCKDIDISQDIIDRLNKLLLMYSLKVYLEMLTDPETSRTARIMLADKIFKESGPNYLQLFPPDATDDEDSDVDID